MVRKKQHYKFNPETLSFDIIQVSLHTRLKRWFYQFLIGCFVAIVWVAVYTSFFETPKEMRLSEENKEILFSYNMLIKKIQEKQLLLADIEERDNNIYRAVFEEDPIPASIRRAGYGGTNRYAEFESMENAKTVISATRELDILTKRAYIQSRSFDRIATLAKNKEQMMLSMPVGTPLNINKVRLSSYFGGRSDPFHGNYKMHEGIDLSPLAGGVGLPIYAAGDGVVTEARYSNGGYGNVVYLDHGFGYSTRYGHLNSLNVVAGQKVKRGDKVGELGNTGRSKGPHLHYEIRLRNVPMNPLNYFEHPFKEESKEILLLDNSPMGEEND